MSWKLAQKGGEEGGQLIFEGSPNLLASENTYTGVFLSKHLENLTQKKKMSDESKKAEKSEFSGDLLSIKRNAFWHLWKRRGLLLVALIFVLIPLWGYLEPLFEFILFAISLAALTYPVFYRPISMAMKRVLQDFHRIGCPSYLLSFLL